MVIIVFGLPGSGKSYLASRLAEVVHAEYVNSDHLRKEIFQKRSYSDREKAFVYDAMLKKMKEAITQNKSVVLDATFYKDETRKLFIQETKEKTNIFFIEVTTSEGLTRQRLNKERPDSEADFRAYQLIKQQWELFNESHLVLESTDDNIDDMLQKAAQYVNNDKRPNQ